jgi:hypothetical protein
MPTISNLPSPPARAGQCHAHFAKRIRGLAIPTLLRPMLLTGYCSQQFEPSLIHCSPPTPLASDRLPHPTECTNPAFFSDNAWSHPRTADHGRRSPWPVRHVPTPGPGMPTAVLGRVAPDENLSSRVAGMMAVPRRASRPENVIDQGDLPAQWRRKGATLSWSDQVTGLTPSM